MQEQMLFRTDTMKTDKDPLACSGFFTTTGAPMTNEEEFNIEDNSDVNASDQSYMSDSSDEEEGQFKAAGDEQRYVERFNFRFGNLLQHNKIPTDMFWQDVKTGGGYSKAKWVKTTFDGVTKRFAEPPHDYDKLVSLLVNSFGVLKSIMLVMAEDQNDGRGNMYSLLQSKVKLQLYARIGFGRPPILLEDTADLKRAFERS